MPVYEYKCEECENRFELLQRFDADRTQECPKCQSMAKRVLSLGSFVLKGGGWYATENRPKPCQEKNTTPATAPSCEPSKCDSCPAAG